MKMTGGYLMTEHNVHEEESVRRSISSLGAPTVHVDGEIKEGGGGRGERC